MKRDDQGDAIERDPDLVRRDVTNNLVSIKCAEDIYGVIIDPVTLQVNMEKTKSRRDEIRKERKARSEVHG